MLEKLKAHPYLAVAAVVAILVLAYIINHSGSGGTTATAAVGGTDVGSATDLLQAQQAAQSQATQLNGAIAANKDNNDAAITLATINAQASGAHDTLAAGVATSQINAEQQTQSLLAALSADVSKTGINADVDKTNIIATNATQQQQILATALVTQSANQAGVAEAGYNAQVTIAGKRGGLFGGGGFLGLGIGS